MRYALLNNNIVVNVIECSAEFASAITDYQTMQVSDTVGIGFEYDGNSFSPPQELIGGNGVVYTIPPHITLLALNFRFTRGERDLIRAAEVTDPDVSDVMYLMRQAKYIDLSRAETIGGVQMLEAKGLLASGRAAEVLDTETLPHERF